MNPRVILTLTLLAIVTVCAVVHFGAIGIGIPAALWLMMPYSSTS